MATVNKLNAADVNHDGVIEHDEFVPVAMEILKSQNGGGRQARRAAAGQSRAAAPAKAAKAVKAAMPKLSEVPVPMLIDSDEAVCHW